MYDCIAVLPHGEVPKAFLGMYGLPKMLSYSLREHSDEGASRLAMEGARRLQHWFDVYREADDNDFLFDEVTSKCPEDIEFVDWQLTKDHMGHTWTRAQELRTMSPRNVLADSSDDGD